MGTPGACDGSFSQDLNTLWYGNPLKNPGGGAVVQAQLWYRDPTSGPCGTGFNLTNGLEVTWGP